MYLLAASNPRGQTKSPLHADGIPIRRQCGYGCTLSGTSPPLPSTARSFSHTQSFRDRRRSGIAVDLLNEHLSPIGVHEFLKISLSDSETDIAPFLILLVLEAHHIIHRVLRKKRQ